MKEAEEPFGADEIAQLFTREGRFLLARWARPVAPVIFGLEDESVAVSQPLGGVSAFQAGIFRGRSAGVNFWPV